MCDAQVKNSVSQVGGKLDVSTPLTPALSHLLCLYCVRRGKQFTICSNAQSWAFLAPEWAVQVLT